MQIDCRTQIDWAVKSAICTLQSAIPCLRLGRDANLLQLVDVRGQFRRGGWEAVDAEDVRDHVARLLRRQLARLLRRRRHRLADLVEELGDALVVPVVVELLAGQRRRSFTALQPLAVAGGAFARVDRLAALVLRVGEDAVPDRARRLRAESDNREGAT